MLLSDLFEAVGSNVLYHGTYSDDAVKIVMDDVLQGRTPHTVRPHNGVRPVDVDGFGSMHGVSMTRDVRFARAWRSGGGIVLGFDADRLKQRHRFQAIDYYGKRREAEEFLVGSIKPVSRYLISISASAETAEEMREQGEEWCTNEILEHPLFRVDGARWHPTTGMASKNAGGAA